MADTLEFSQVAFPRERFTDELIAELERTRPASWRSATATATARPRIIKHPTSSGA
jgi:isocitrate dehydrogenase kinase/phosphatase